MKSIIGEVFADVWMLACKFYFRKLDDAQWKVFIDDGKKLLEKYRKQEKSVELLYRNLFYAVQEFYQNRGE